jgi:hypothetical protein
LVVVVVVVVESLDAGGVTMTALVLPGSPFSPFGPSGPGVPGGPGTGTTVVVDDGGVFTTAGGLVTTVGRSHAAITPIDAIRLAKSSEDFFMCFSIMWLVNAAVRHVRRDTGKLRGDRRNVGAIAHTFS